MGAHRTNPVALANAVPQQKVRVMELGDGIGLVGLSFEPMKKADGSFCVGVIATGGRMSDLVPMEPRRVMIGIIPTLPMEAIRALLDGREPEAPVTPEAA